MLLAPDAAYSSEPAVSSGAPCSATTTPATTTAPSSTSAVSYSSDSTSADYLRSFGEPDFAYRSRYIDSYVEY